MNPLTISKMWEGTADSYRRDFNQSVDEEMLNSLIGECVVGTGTFQGKEYSFAGLIVGWEKTVLGHPSEEKSVRYTLVSEEGLGFTITTDTVLEIEASSSVTVDGQPHYFAGEVVGSQLYTHFNCTDMTLVQKSSSGEERVLSRDELIDLSHGSEFVSVPTFLLEENQ